MDLRDWIKPGLYIKRWFILGAIGIIFICIGIYPFIGQIWDERLMKDYWIFLLIGILTIGIALRRGIVSILSLIITSRMDIRCKIDKKLYEKRILNKGPKIVVIGGGTGLSVLLRGLKKYTSNITAIVTVADDGGGSGILREDLGLLPPGDIRNCILALADTEPVMERLLQYRFEEGQLKGQSFGNLLIAAMNGISSNNFEEAIRKINDVFAVTGKVLPVTLEDITLYAKLRNGKTIKGESQIPKKVKEFDSEIESVFIKPSSVKPLDESIEAIREADIVVLGPGSLYTSIIPNLMVEDIRRAIKESKSIKVYITNVMTQPGETDGYGVWEHVEAIIKHMKSQVIDYVFVNNEEISLDVLKKYVKDGAEPIRLKKGELEKLYKNGIKVKEGPFIDIKNQYIRHDADSVSDVITRLALEDEYDMNKRGKIYRNLKKWFKKQ